MKSKIDNAFCSIPLNCRTVFHDFLDVYKKAMSRSFITLLLFLTGTLSLPAQPFLKPPFLQPPANGKPVLFDDVEGAFENYWGGDETCSNGSESCRSQFARWKYFFYPRTFPSGEFPSSEILYQEYQKYKQAYPAQRMEGTASANWTFIGPSVVPGNNGGAGRVNCMAFDPSNSSIIWAGAACGGLWKSTDGGITWSSNTDLLPSLSISDIVINPANAQEMYLATGDKYGIYYLYSVWGHYSAGVLKSTDGGITWTQTALNYTLANNVIIQRLVIDPQNTSTLYAATNQGIFKTTNGGSTWANIQAGSYYDIEMKPGATNTLYAGTPTGVIISNDAGQTWAPAPGVSSSGRTSIVVSAANPAVLYVWTESGNFYYSGNSGISFTTRSNPWSLLGGIGYYDLVLEVSSSNENVLLAGTYNIAKSTDGGMNWTQISDWSTWPASSYVHVDHHDLKFVPGSTADIYACNDGGVFRSTDQGLNWTDLSNGLHIKQYYRMASSMQNSNMMYAGAQDNGTDRITSINTASQVYGADGQDCLVDYSDDNIVYISKQGGTFLKSIDQGNTFSWANTTGGGWTCPIAIDPVSPNILYVGAQYIKKTVNAAQSWTNIFPYTPTGFIDLKVANSAPTTLYAAELNKLWSTHNRGVTWTEKTAGLPVNNAGISRIAISSTDSNSVWVTFSGFSAGNKVFHSSDAGNTWVNVSGSLPNIPVNCITYQSGGPGVVYIGTDLGVFFMDGTMNDWLPYNTGLPNIIIYDLDVYTPTGKLRAATFGRGLWESDLHTPVVQSLDASVISAVEPSVSSCLTSVTPVVRLRNAGTSTINSVQVYYRLDAQPYQLFNWSGTLTSFATTDVTLPAVTLPYGNHVLKVYTSAPNSSTDQNNLNDTLTYPFLTQYIPGIAPPVTEGFVNTAFPPANWTLDSTYSIWERNGSVGGYGQSSESAKADFYGPNSGTDYLCTPYIDFSILSPPIRLYFDVAYSYSFTQDSLILELYSDCDQQPLRIYGKADSALMTTGYTGTPFVPASTQWRTDTVNLNTYAGYGPMQVRFAAKTQGGNNLYIDNVNLSSAFTGVVNLFDGSAVNVYPNPSQGELNVDIISVEQEEITLTLLDVAGRVLQLLPVKVMSGRNPFKIDLSTFGKGVYFLRLDGVKGNVTKRFIKI